MNKLLLRSLLISLLAFNYYVGHAQQKNAVAFSYDTILLEPIGKSYSKTAKVTEYQTQADMGGTTSIRSMDEAHLSWKTGGYYQRNRDIGQIFIPKKDTYVEGIVMRTGPSESAVLYNTPGAEVFIQFFEITGTPVINDNGTPVGTSSAHGYTTNHRADDFIDSIEYTSLPVIYKGIFPASIPNTRDAAGNHISDAGKLYYIRWKFASPKLLRPIKITG
ncbi:MAG: hypothetical protein HC896_12910, partial [Bacteroidales bacterium]|nr:hypothetical protein [Bacteroidales bacterium]